LRATFEKLKNVSEDAVKYLVSAFGGVSGFQIRKQSVEGLTDFLQVFLYGFLALDPLGVMPGAILDVGCEAFCQPHFVRSARDALEPLDGCHQQLQAAG